MKCQTYYYKYYHIREKYLLPGLKRRFFDTPTRLDFEFFRTIFIDNFFFPVVFRGCFPAIVFLAVTFFVVLFLGKPLPAT